MPGRGRRLLSTKAAAGKAGDAESRAAQAGKTRHRVVAFGSSALAGLVVWFLVGPWLHGATRFVAGYDVSALTLLSHFMFGVLHGTAEHTKRRAAIEDPGRNYVLLVVLGAVIVGMVSAIAIIGHGPQAQNMIEKTFAYVLGVGAIAIGWFLVHVTFTLRYAHLYWYDANDDGQPGGMKFPDTDEPSDVEFAYLAFTIGTSFAVSDPQITSGEVRREIIWHSVISFAYNSVIIGMVINLFAGLFGGGK